jgi:hypothetical protein
MMAGPPRKAVELTPLVNGHHALVVKRGVAFSLTVLLFCFAK